MKLDINAFIFFCSVVKSSKKHEKRTKYIELKTRKFRIRSSDVCQLDDSVVFWETDPTVKFLVSKNIDLSSLSEDYGETVFGNIIVPESERSNNDGNGPFGAYVNSSSDSYASIVLKKFKKSTKYFHKL